jgi:hypothetical protein
MLLAFIPMLLIASASYYMNRADPDCGTTFAWVTKAMGPWLGWMGGWAIVVADVIVKPLVVCYDGTDGERHLRGRAARVDAVPARAPLRAAGACGPQLTCPNHVRT